MILCLFISGCDAKQSWLGEDAIVTPSGLEYIVLQKGNGPAPLAGNEIVAHCVLKIGDSTIFWNTRNDGDKFTFVYKHIWNRVGQLMEKLTRKGYGYGTWMQNLETTFDQGGTEE